MSWQASLAGYFTNVKPLKRKLADDRKEYFKDYEKDKRVLRSRLGNDLLNQSLVIKLESPEIKGFNPEKAIHHWNTTGVRARRPLVKPRSTCMIDTSVSSTETEESNTFEPEPEVSAESVPVDSCTNNEQNCESDNETDTESDFETEDTAYEKLQLYWYYAF